MRERKPKSIERNKSGVPALKARVWQAVRGFGIRRLRYIGQSKTHLQQIVSATAINFVRVNSWLQEIPPAKTRQPLFAKVMRGKYSQN